jgi:hypothetical protein
MSLVQSGLGIGLVPQGIRYIPDGVKLLRLAEPLNVEMGLALPRDTANQLAIKLRALALIDVGPDPGSRT